MRRRDVSPDTGARAKVLARLRGNVGRFYNHPGDEVRDPARWLARIGELEARVPVVVAGWELSPRVPAYPQSWWLLAGDDSLVELSRDDLLRRGWDFR